MSDRTDAGFMNEASWRFFWHPVCTLHELHTATPSRKGPLKVQLLDTNLVIADLGGEVVALADRCAHRSTSLSRGVIDNGKLRCAYHGWAYASDGMCVEIPACPGQKIPSRARVEKYDTAVRYDLVWVRLDSSIATTIPACPGFEDSDFKAVQGDPYTWPTSAGRRLENFADLAHLPFVHPNTLFDPNMKEVAPRTIERIAGQLVFQFDPVAEEMPISDVALMGKTDYRITMPFAANLEFTLISKQGKGERAILWMCASPVTSGSCRSFWFTCRDHNQDEPDHPHLAFQNKLLEEDIYVIEANDPPEIPADVDEISVQSDLVSIQYRKWLREINAAAEKSSADVATVVQLTEVENVAGKKWGSERPLSTPRAEE